MELTAGALARAIGARIEGDDAHRLVGVAPLEEAAPDQVSFLSNRRYRERALASRAGALIVGERDVAGLTAATLLVARDPYVAYARAVRAFHPEPAGDGEISPRASVDGTAIVGPRCSVGPFAAIGAGCRLGARVRVGAGCAIGRDVTIGDDTLLYPNVTLYDGVVIGMRVILHAGVVVGSDGFGFAQEGEAYVKVPQVGTVEVEDDVEIGANSTVDRAALGRTVIGRGTKIDNLVQIAHNVRIGAHTAIAALSGISGSTTLGRGAKLAGQSGVSGHLSLGDGVVVAGKAAVFKDLPDGAFVSGIPARPHRQWMRREAALNRIGELKQRVALLETRLAELAHQTPKGQ